MKTCEVDGEPNSETHYELVDRPGADVARLRLSPVTGRRHQLRVHCAAIGMPIVGDPIYPVLQPETDEEDYARPLRLLARSLAFADPATGEAREFHSRLSLQAPR
jgi:tRNA pseudouridine32 synthase/23S rRNA pseudouridine746 synthase